MRFAKLEAMHTFANLVLKFKFSDDVSHNIKIEGTSITLGPTNVFVGVEERDVPS